MKLLTIFFYLFISFVCVGHSSVITLFLKPTIQLKTSKLESRVKLNCDFTISKKDRNTLYKKVDLLNDKELKEKYLSK